MTSRTTPAALVFAAVLSACRTAAPARPATEDAARRAPAANVVYVPYSPTILVARGDEPFVLLHAIVTRTNDGPPSLDAKGYPILRSGVSGPNRAGNRARGWV